MAGHSHPPHRPKRAAPRRTGPRGRRQGGYAAPRAGTSAGVLFGTNAVEAALQARRRALHTLHVRGGGRGEKPARLIELAREGGVPVQEHDTAGLEALCPGQHHQGVVLSCGPLPVLDDRSALALGGWPPGQGGLPPLLLALDQVEDPRNLGAIARAAAAFGVRGLVQPRDHSAPLSAVASSASAGALERLPVHAVANLARFCEQAQRAGFWVLGAAAEGGEPIAGYTHDRPLLLVLGSEGRGLRPLVARNCDQLVTIPLPGRANAESLNVASAAAVLLYQLVTYR